MKKRKSTANQYLLIAGMTTASLISGCNKTEKEWANSPGTNGFINLDAVRNAFRKNPKVEDFEMRVNEIFEGDNLIIFNTKEIKGGFCYTAKEDLDKDKEISSGDETLFTLTVANGKAILKGEGVNKYYEQSWRYTLEEDKNQYSNTSSHRHHFHHWYWGRGWGGYYTPRQSYDRMYDSRNTYRQSSAFVSQVNNNVDFENKMSKKYGTSFRKNVTGASSVRKNYIKNTKKSSGFKSFLSRNKSSSGWGKRSNSSSRSSFARAKGSSRSFGRSGGRSGGFRGSSGFGV